MGVTWIMSPLLMILWLIYNTGEPGSPYYAGLNIILLGMGLLTPWAKMQNVLVTVFVLMAYAYVLISKNIKTPEELKIIVNNMTFLFLTCVIVVSGSIAGARLRYREFKSQWDLKAAETQLVGKNVELEGTIEKLKAAESQLVQQEKMASLGVMSAGIIHEINNPLNFATTGLYTLRKKGKYVAPDQKAEFEDIVKDIEDGVSRVKNIVSDLRMFTHPGSDDLDEVEVSEAVTSALRFLSNEWKDKVHIEQKLLERQTVRANKTKLIHVLTNLLQNSLDAMREKSFNGEQPTIWIEGRVENGASIVTVRDNGPGIKSEHLGKIFDPFFTTKDVGAGMGLGLSICYRIVQESNGKISVRTEPGKFCEFTLEFPLKG